jgi:hypothetical protein
MVVFGDGREWRQPTAGAGDGGDDAVGRYFADAIFGAVGDVQIAFQD